MPTENPKVSGYVPQAVYDRLIQFKDERGVSISQAVTVVLAEYFGVDHRVDQASLGGVTLAQIENLDQKLTDFIESVDHRFEKLEAALKSYKPLSSLLVDQDKRPAKVSADSLLSGLLSEISSEVENAIDITVLEVNPVSEEEKAVLPDELSSELLGGDISNGSQVEHQDTVTVLPDEPLSELLNGEEPEKAVEEKPILDIQPLSPKQLAERLKVNLSVVTRYKRGIRKQSLADWSRTQDPDGVAWEYSDEQKKYLPIKASSEPMFSLQGELLKPGEVEIE